jgi:predicted N-acetyltransferase YhbS
MQKERICPIMKQSECFIVSYCKNKDVKRTKERIAKQMIQCRKAIPEENDEIIDFINYVFSQNERPHDFKKLLPKLYGDSRNYAGIHYLLREDDKIKALICAMPIEYSIYGNELNACCIGMVSVHPYARSKGYMKLLMKEALTDIKSQGYHYVFLGGQRQRYEYFGFEPSGIQMEFNLTSDNARHGLTQADCTPVKIVPLTTEELLDKAYSFYEAQPVHAHRNREDFYDILSTWGCVPYGIIVNYEFSGYLTMSSNGWIPELLLVDKKHYSPVLKALFTFIGKEQFSLLAAPYDFNKINYLQNIAESHKITTSESFKVFNWKQVILTFLGLKSKLEYLAEGVLRIGIEDSIYEIKVRANIPSVHKTSKEADFSMTELTATRLLLSQIGSYGLKDYTAGLAPEQLNCISSWFPLPLTAIPVDCC